MKITVQKFGGTSVATPQNREKVAERIINQHNAGYSVVVIVSAMGRENDEYATDTLLKLVDREKTGSRELDLLMSCGEIISGVVLSDLLGKKGYKSKVLTGYQAGILTDSNFGDARVLEVNPQRIITHLEQGEIVIVTGFQGGTVNGDITTLGRGGSDTSAVLIGGALNCDFIEIFTDVDGIMTADPRIVPDARLLLEMSYSEVYQLAEDGAKVIHPRAVEIAERNHIKIIVKNTFNDGCGTIIKDKEKNFFLEREKNIITAITSKRDRAQIIIESNQDKDSADGLMDLITRNNISIDLINFSKDKKVFTVDHKDVSAIEEILEEEDCKYKIIKNCSKLSIIGNRMRGIPGVMFRIVKALARENIEILQTSDSHTTIWCLVRGIDADKAVRSLHKEFNLSSLEDCD